MFIKNRKENSGTAILSGTSLMLLLLFGLTTAVFGQTTADKVRDKLGKAKIEDKDGFFTMRTMTWCKSGSIKTKKCV